MYRGICDEDVTPPNDISVRAVRAPRESALENPANGGRLLTAADTKRDFDSSEVTSSRKPPIVAACQLESLVREGAGTGRSVPLATVLLLFPEKKSWRDFT